MSLCDKFTMCKICIKKKPAQPMMYFFFVFSTSFYDITVLIIIIKNCGGNVIRRGMWGNSGRFSYPPIIGHVTHIIRNLSVFHSISCLNKTTVYDVIEVVDWLIKNKHGNHLININM